jgi:putative peptide zinc metalloprotease protein
MTPGTIASPSRPKIRSDLIIRAHTSASGKPFVVKDPVSQEFFGLREVEHFVVEQLDGSTSLDAVRRRAEERFGAQLEAETLTRFVRSLGELGLLESSAPERAPAPRWRLQGDLLYLRLRLFDPNRLLGWLVGPSRLFFTRTFLGVSAGLIQVALLEVVASSRELAPHLMGLFRLDILPLFWITVLVVGMAHEFAHGVTCRRFGGQVHDIGFMLIYFTPAFYCNVSDTWLFPEKSRRLLVTFAGVYFELFIWAVATMTWWVTDYGTWINLIAMVVMATSGVKTLVNLNPLIKLDGYYLLSDALGIPNLRRRAFAYIGGLLRRDSAGEPVPPTLRERRVFLWYGLTAAIYSFVLLGVIIFKLGPVLIERYQLAGLLLLGLLVGPRLRSRLRRFAPRRSKALQRGPSAPAALPDDDAERSSPPAKGRTERKWRRRLWAAAVIAAAAVLLFLFRMELRVAGEFTVLPTGRSDVRSMVEGIVASIDVDEGSRVEKGHVVARLTDRDRAAELIGVQAEIAEKQAMLRLLLAGPTREELVLATREVITADARQAHSEKRLAEARQMRSEQIAKLQATVRKSEDSLGFKRLQFERFRTLVGLNLVSRKQFEEAEEVMVVTQRELEVARAELAVTMADDLAEVRKELALAETQAAEARGKQAVLVAKNRPEEIEAREAELARLQAKRGYFEESSRLLAITSPLSGVVTTPSRQLRQMVGQSVAKGDLLATVQNLGTVMTEIAVPEKEIADVKVGQPVVIKLRAYPNETFEGRVTTIATSVRSAAVPGATPKDAPAAPKPPDEGPGERVVLVTSEIENAALLLKPDMTGKAKIYCGPQPLIQLMTRRLARIVRVEFWSWW